MAKLTLIIQSSANDRAKSVEAIQFIHAALNLGHEIICAFFYREAVDHAQVPTPEKNEELVTQWKSLSHQHQIPLVVCHTVAERMGVNEFHPAFEASGLTALAAAIANSDRTLQF